MAKSRQCCLGLVPQAASRSGGRVTIAGLEGYFGYMSLISTQPYLPTHYICMAQLLCNNF